MKKKSREVRPLPPETGIKTVKAEKKRKVRFAVESAPNAEVFVAGTFNNWNPTANRLRLQGDYHSADIMLPPGTHEYKFIIDGAWMNDPCCANRKANEFASLNDVLVVK